MQRALLDWLKTDPGGTYKNSGPVDMSITEAARAVFGVDEPTDAQRASVRRAARVLADKGLIQSNGRRGWDAGGPTYQRSCGYCGVTHRGSAHEVQLSETYIQRLPTKSELAAHRAYLDRLGGLEAKIRASQ